jgi:hypothetical protein
MRTLLVFLGLALVSASGAVAQEWRNLFNGKNLDGWQARGECLWTVMQDGILLGQREHKKPSDPFGNAWPIAARQYTGWLYRQAWLYTVAEFGEYDLHVEYFMPKGVNSGVSIRDVSRGHYAIGEPEPAPFAIPAGTPKSTPAHIGYEIQVIDGDSDKFSTGSVYTLAAAKKGVQKDGQWNSLDIESRNDHIRVKLNGEVVAEHPGLPERPKVGPIGLQLHDQFSFAMFRNIRIREIKK